MDQALRPVANKVDAWQRFIAEDGLTLLRSWDIWTPGALANHARHKLHGRKTYYNVNRPA